jgi:hypothetical protein
MVPLSKSGVRKHRGFESHPLRQTLTRRTAHPRVGPSAPSLTDIRVRSLGCSGPPWAGLAHRARECQRRGPQPGVSRHSPWTSWPILPAERSPRGLGRRTGNAVWGNPSRVRIPPSPPSALRTRPNARGALLSLARRARRGTSGALYLQSAPAGLNSLSRSPLSKAALPCDVEGRVPRSGDSRTGSGPEGSSPKR